MQLHRPYSWVAGDDFMLNVRLTDQERNPYELDKLDWIKYLLHNGKGQQIVPMDHIKTFIDAADGRLSIWVPNQVTTFFPTDIYTDWLRISCGGIVSTLLTGPVSITADPWRAEIAPAMFSATRSTASAEIVVLLDRRERVHRIKRAA